MRFNSQSNGIVDLRVVLLNGVVKQYIEHPNPDVDIAAVMLNCPFVLSNGAKINYFDIDENCFDLSQMKTNGVEEGSFVYTLGFPMNLVNNTLKAPICRMGCISQISTLYIQNSMDQNYLVDAQTFPGNSGGPVICRPEPISIQGTPANMSSKLIGILSGHISYTEPLMSIQTKRTVMIREENSGLTIVYPVDKIREVIDLFLKSTLSNIKS